MKRKSVSKILTFTSVVLLAVFASCTSPSSSSTKSYTLSHAVPSVAGHAPKVINGKAVARSARNISMGSGETTADPALFAISPVVTGWINSVTADTDPGAIVDGSTLTYNYFGSTMTLAVRINNGVTTYTTEDSLGGFIPNTTFKDASGNQDTTTYGDQTLDNTVVWGNNKSSVTAVLQADGKTFSVDQKLFIANWDTYSHPSEPSEALLDWVYYTHLVIPAGVISPDGTGFTAVGSEYVVEDVYTNGGSTPTTSQIATTDATRHVYANNDFLVKADASNVAVLLSQPSSGNSGSLVTAVNTLLAAGPTGDTTTLSTPVQSSDPNAVFWANDGVSCNSYPLASPYTWTSVFSGSGNKAAQTTFLGL